MGGLADVPLRTSYHRGRDDIAGDFYLPCMRLAREYDRAVGYFRSTAFIVAWPALREFVRNNGRVRVLCSHVLSHDDIMALQHGYEARADAVLSERFRTEVQSFVEDPVVGEPARILAALVANETIELKVALLEEASTARIFHDKLGIFRDSEGNTVIFKGSMNETWSGLASDGNLESIDVAASWMGARDLERVENEQRYFHDLWRDNYPTVKVRPFPQVALEEFVKAADLDWEGTVARLLSTVAPAKAAERSEARVLRGHQAAGLASWRANNRRGILAFCTGSGKTFTAISAIREALTKECNPALVVVPDQVLFDQWYKELSVDLADTDVKILRAGSGYSNWRDNVGAWTQPGPVPRLLLATVQTASSEEFRTRIMGGDHLLLVADEVHRLGSTRNRNLLNGNLFGPRLGLSATPERAGDIVGTTAILTFFEGILEPRYSLADAVRDRVLCPYFYRPHVIRLTSAELEAWQSLSQEIAQLRARLESTSGTEGLEERIQRLLIRRASIVKHAESKVPLAVDVLKQEWRRGQRWIIYCEDTDQLSDVVGALSGAGIQSMPFHSQMEGDRYETLEWLRRRGGVLVAIRCLDEGVDIPSVTHALILASSKNPREFVQRRGRVLRTSPGKALAYIHDAVVLPPRDSKEQRNDDTRTDPIIAGELARAVQFAESADNPSAATDLQQIAIEMGIDWRGLARGGIEDGD